MGNDPGKRALICKQVCQGIANGNLIWPADPVFHCPGVFFVPEWYTKISQAAAGSSGIILFSVFIFIGFFSYFRMHFKWEMNDQLYQELKKRKDPRMQRMNNFFTLTIKQK